jgi:hypothetical protein
MKIMDLVFRSWYYFRVGYATYLVFPIGYVSTLVTLYYLAVKNLPEVERFFPRFLTFAILATALALPISVLVGWTHLKRSKAWKTEMDISVESNPYYYKLPPGYYIEVMFPILKELLSNTAQLLDKQGLVDVSRKEKLEELQKKLEVLLQGGIVGRPRLKL